MASRTILLSRLAKHVAHPAPGSTLSRAAVQTAASLTTALRFPQTRASRPLHSHSHRPPVPSRPSSTRHISSSAPRASNPSVAQSFADPDRPDLHYHLFTPPTQLSSEYPVFALSFLPTPPPSILSSSVIGWLPASGEGEGAGLNDFVENERFLAVLHEAIQSALRDGVDEVQKAGATQTHAGWMHIHDGRNVPALQRVGDPDDIIASVRVEDGEILAETYQPMPAYRLCTSDGVLQLTEGLAARLVEVLEARVKQEHGQGQR
ncbi:hypothetical protein BD311DRAFT_673735 [Dichomitus squalens]|uniref:Uncharacterized protein n=1 Tax=Dichomitus squalens TaxID=114155 RepID=A0A4V2JZ36_9APHY|nr:hypothetical protein BD311DRAFT_673735 [Dichomitus squalens]